MHFALTVALGVTAAAISLAQAPQPEATSSTGIGSAEIEFAATSFDFGRVTQGDVVQHDFAFKNTGDTVLEITSVRPGCGCTITGNWDKRVDPGQSGIIPIQFNSANFTGKVAKSVTVTSNSRGASIVSLQIRATVWKPFEIRPSVVAFTVVKDDQKAETKILRIVNNQEEPVTISDVESNNASFRAELNTLHAGKEFELRITTVPPFNFGSVSDLVTMKTSSPHAPQIQVKAFATLVEPVSVMPDRLSIPHGPIQKTLTSRITIRNYGRDALLVSDARATTDEVKVQVEEVQQGRQFKITAQFPAGFELKPGDFVAVTVNTNHPKYPVIRVPVVLSQSAVAKAKVSDERLPADAVESDEDPVDNNGEPQ